MYIHHNKFMQKLSDFLVKRKIKNKFIVSQFVSNANSNALIKLKSYRLRWTFQHELLALLVYS